MPPETKTSDPMHVVDVQEANGWYAIETDGHPKKLKTNREEGGREAGRHKLERNLVQIQYAERNDKPNPHGGFYHDYYWYAARVAEAPSANGDGDDGITRVKSTRPETAPEEAWRISLSVGTERAVALAPHLPEAQQDFPFVWALSYEFAKRIFLTPPPAPDSLEPLPVAEDDDIPF